MKKIIPGINIQWPWSQLLLTGKKTIETRSYPLPEKYKNVELAVIETPGLNGRRESGILKARIIGTITFSGSIRYSTKAEWLRDQDQHLVPRDSNLFRFSSEKDKWGWVVKEYKSFRHHKQPSLKRGIVFARECHI
jgi:hypothetical protein